MYVYVFFLITRIIDAYGIILFSRLSSGLGFGTIISSTTCAVLRRYRKVFTAKGTVHEIRGCDFADPYVHECNVCATRDIATTESSDVSPITNAFSRVRNIQSALSLADTRAR